MIRILVEAGDGVGRFVVEVRAGSVCRALELAGERYPRGGVSLVFPIDPEYFFVKEPVSRAELVEISARERPATAVEGLTGAIGGAGVRVVPDRRGDGAGLQ